MVGTNKSPKTFVDLPLKNRRKIQQKMLKLGMANSKTRVKMAVKKGQQKIATMQPKRPATAKADRHCRHH